MPIDVYEKWDSRELTLGENASAELRYVVRGTDSDADAYAAAKDASPIAYAGLYRQTIQLERIADDTWEASVQYGQRPPANQNETLPDLSSYEFDTTGGTQHITQSLHTRRRYGVQIAPDLRGAIGVTKDGVEGVDITVPVFHFSETHRLPDAVVTPWYVNTLFSLTGTVNDAPFRMFQAGEVLFLGASGSKRGMDLWEITFRFAANPNVSGLQIGEITNIEKQGWDYLWVRYTDWVDEYSNLLVKKPVNVYIEQVYRSGNFMLLGIGM